MVSSIKCTKRRSDRTKNECRGKRAIRQGQDEGTPNILQQQCLGVCSAGVCGEEQDEDNYRKVGFYLEMVLGGFEDPDLFGLEKSFPTAGRSGKMWILCLAAIFKWQVICEDVRAAFLSGAGFTRDSRGRLWSSCLVIVPHFLD